MHTDWFYQGAKNGTLNIFHNASSVFKLILLYLKQGRDFNKMSLPNCRKYWYSTEQSNKTIHAKIWWKHFILPSHLSRIYKAAGVSFSIYNTFVFNSLEQVRTEKGVKLQFSRLQCPNQQPVGSKLYSSVVHVRCNNAIFLHSGDLGHSHLKDEKEMCINFSNVGLCIVKQHHASKPIRHMWHLQSAILFLKKQHSEYKETLNINFI